MEFRNTSSPSLCCHSYWLKSSSTSRFGYFLDRQDLQDQMQLAGLKRTLNRLLKVFSAGTILLKCCKRRIESTQHSAFLPILDLLGCSTFLQHLNSLANSWCFRLLQLEPSTRKRLLSSRTKRRKRIANTLISDQKYGNATLSNTKVCSSTHARLRRSAGTKRRKELAKLSLNDFEYGNAKLLQRQERIARNFTRKDC